MGEGIASLVHNQSFDEYSVYNSDKQLNVFVERKEKEKEREKRTRREIIIYHHYLPAKKIIEINKFIDLTKKFIIMNRVEIVRRTSH